MNRKQALKFFAIVFLVNSLFVSTGCGFRQLPDDTVKKYVRSLSKGQCKRAYGMVYLTTREYDPRYSSYKEFKLNVCDPVERKYDRVRVVKIDNVIGGGSEAIVNFWIIFDPKAVPYKGKRPMMFEMVKSGRRWYVKGPSLEI